ncbi:MAG: c-type cytochrome [Chloroflexota bacterium]
MHKPLYYYLYTRSPILKLLWSFVSVLVMFAVVGFVGWTEEGRMEAQTANWDGRSIEKGAALYDANCSSCHGKDGKGLPMVAPALRSRYLFSKEIEVNGEKVAAGRLNDVAWAGSLNNYIMLTVGAGRPSKGSAHWANVMPTWGGEYGGPLRGDQVIAVTNYVMNFESDAMAQTAEEDPWQFFQDTLSKRLPYHEDEPGYEQKLEQALAAAEAAGVTSYTLGDEEYTFAQPDDVADMGPRTPQELWLLMGCSGCHNINEDQTANNVGPVGPHQNNLYERAAERVEGQSAEEYVYNSIVEPDAYVVEGYNGGVMPQTFADMMSEEEINALVAWALDPDREQ